MTSEYPTAVSTKLSKFYEAKCNRYEINIAPQKYHWTKYQSVIILELIAT